MTPREICQECGAHCCKNAVMFIDSSEMRRIKALSKEFKVFCKGPNSWQVEMAFQKDHHCPFLTKENLCRVYDERPIACRRYPEREEANCPLSAHTS